MRPEKTVEKNQPQILKERRQCLTTACTTDLLAQVGYMCITFIDLAESEGGNHDGKEIRMEWVEDADPASQRPGFLRNRMSDLRARAERKQGREVFTEHRDGHHFRWLLVG
jgi:hypothetical protein